MSRRISAAVSAKPMRRSAGAVARNGGADLCSARGAARPPLRGYDRGRRCAVVVAAASIMSRDSRVPPTSSSSSSGIIRVCSNAWRACAFPAMRTRVLVAHFGPVPAGDSRRPDRGGRPLRLHHRGVAVDALARRSAARRRRKKIAVINSGFGFAEAPKRAPAKPEARPSRISEPSISSRCIRDFSTPSIGWTATTSAFRCGAIRQAAVAARARAMRHPERIQFGGADRRARCRAFGGRHFFLSAATRSLRHGGERARRGDVARARAGRARQSGGNGDRSRRRDRLRRAVDRGMRLAFADAALGADLREKVSRNAIRFVADNEDVGAFRARFHDLVARAASEPASQCNFRDVVGDSPADWFLSTQCLPGIGLGIG